jgi:hypothetical protein
MAGVTGNVCALVLCGATAWAQAPAAQAQPQQPDASASVPLVAQPGDAAAAPAPADPNAPPPAEAPPALDAVPVDAAAAVEGENAPPSMDATLGEGVPPAQVAPPPQRPFTARLAGLESGLMVAALVGGWALAAATAVGAGLAASSWATGRVQWDFPRTAFNMVRFSNENTEGSKMFSGQNAGVMVGSVVFSALTGAVLAAGVATLVGLFSQDWSTLMGPPAAAGILAGAVCIAVGGTIFLASLVIPFPPLWLATFGLAMLMGIVVPPVAVLLGQLFTKQARAVPGGLITTLLQALPTNPLARGALGAAMPGGGAPGGGN